MRSVPPLLLCLHLLAPAVVSSAPSRAIAGVTVSPPFFNPSAGQSATVEFRVERPGRLTVMLFDRDGFPMRRLWSGEVAAGAQHLSWDGRDDAGVVVPDEAYWLRVELAGAGAQEVYAPGEQFTPLREDPAITSYSRSEGVLSYTLTRTARVHIQAGQAKVDAKTGEASGPILKTVIDRVPRVAGAVTEVWNGMDESGTIYVPDLPHFVIGILAASLPENSLITVGNRRQSFADYARAREPALRGPPGPHHANLDALQDRSWPLRLTLDGSWDRTRRFWNVDREVRVSVEIPADDPHSFLSQPTELLVYLDDVLLARRERPAHPAQLQLDLERFPLGEHRLVVNWVSDYGPVAVGATRIEMHGGVAPEEAK